MPEKTSSCPPITPADLARAVDILRQARARFSDMPNVAVSHVQRALESTWPDPAVHRAVRWRLFALLSWLTAHAPDEISRHEAGVVLRAAIIVASTYPLPGKTFAGRLAPGFAGKVESVKSALIADQN